MKSINLKLLNAEKKFDIGKTRFYPKFSQIKLQNNIVLV